MSALVRGLTTELERAGTANEIADIARRAIMALAKAHRALENAEIQFSFYEQQHKDKAAKWAKEGDHPQKEVDNTRAKAAVNASFVVQMREARR